MSINDQPLEHRSYNGSLFVASRCDLQEGVEIQKSKTISEVQFAQDVAEFAAWHRGNIWSQLNGFSGYDCIRFTIFTKD